MLNKEVLRGNQFRHALATMAILFDYKLIDDYVLLKAAVIHDLIEDVLKLMRMNYGIQTTRQMPKKRKMSKTQSRESYSFIKKVSTPEYP